MWAGEPMGRIIAVDIGATNLRVALFEGERPVAVRKTQTPRTSGSDLVKAIVDLVRDVSGGYDFEAIGVASIGPLDLRNGTLLWAPNLGYGNVNIRDSLGSEFQRPVYLTNDALAGAWAEKVLGAGKELEDLAYVTMSTGLGVGAVVDGNLIVGRRGNAHELGHSIVDFESELRCGCGGNGHWEAYVGGRNIPRTAQYLTSRWSGPRTKAFELASRGELSPEALYSMARQGDEFARYAVSFINRVHAAGMMNIIAAYDPEAIFIGGSIYLYNEDLIKGELIEFMKEYVGVFGVPRIERCTFGDDEVLYGAAATAINPPQAIARSAYRPR
ncbi:ADP-dependent hexokinase (HK) [Acidilobus saccharovorans 345-15]|uniref:ADP-dependent hexokinase (HK) n=2 Tax=Acidilobus TaxID=105850 RepID=D9Q1U6_ACIS3|nr:ADP-dependent hexokinase (HK) [Acidilobus saccharovorans 345-15]